MIKHTIVLSMLMSVAAAADDTGKTLYEEHCSTCHQSDGSGVPMMQPALIGSAKVTGSKGVAIKMILKGSEAVPIGSSEYMAEMPGFDFLTDQEIALLATYIRTNFENNSSTISAADVAAERGK